MAIKLTIARIPGRGPFAARLDGDALRAVAIVDRDGLARVLDSAFDPATAGAEGLHNLVLSAERAHWNEDNGRQTLVRCLGFDDWADLRKAVGGRGRVRCEIVGREG